MDFVKLASICNLKQWSTIAKTDLSDSGYPVWGANGIIGYSNKYNHTERTIMICCRGATCGSINISDGKCYINGNAMCLDNLSKEFNLDFIAYYLKNYDFKKTITGVAQPQITKISLDIVEVPKLPIEKQQEIAQNLKKLELCLTKTRIKLKKYDDLVKSQFIEMFENEKFENVNLENVCTKITDGSHNPPKGIDFSNYPMLSSQNINQQINFSNVRYLNESDFLRENKRTQVAKGDILVTIVGTIGRSVVVQDEIITLQRSVAVIKPNSNMNSYYINQYLKSETAQKQFSRKAHGSSQKGIYLGDLKKLQIPTPPIELQNQFADFVKHIDKLKFSETITKLKNLCYNVFNVIQSKNLGEVKNDKL